RFGHLPEKGAQAHWCPPQSSGGLTLKPLGNGFPDRIVHVLDAQGNPTWRGAEKPGEIRNIEGLCRHLEHAILQHPPKLGTLLDAKGVAEGLGDSGRPVARRRRSGSLLHMLVLSCLQKTYVYH